MASTFKNAKLVLTTSNAAVYTCPGSTTAIITGIKVANIDGAASADVTITWTDNSDSDTATNLLKTVPVPADSLLEAIDKPIVLEANDALKALASANGDLELTATILELT